MSIRGGSGCVRIQYYIEGTGWVNGGSPQQIPDGDYIIPVHFNNGRTGRIADCNQELFSNVITVDNPICPVEEEVLIINSITNQSCNTETGVISLTLNCNIQNPSGEIKLEYWDGVSWLIIASMIQNGANNYSGFPNQGQSITLRLRDMGNNTYSDPFTTNIIDCVINSIVILQAISSCDGNQQDASVQIELDYDSTGHTMELQYFDGVDWIQVLTTPGDDQLQYYVSGNSLVPSGVWVIRVHDISIDIYSQEVFLNFVDCEPTTVELISAEIICSEGEHYLLYNFEWSGVNPGDVALVLFNHVVVVEVTLPTASGNSNSNVLVSVFPGLNYDVQINILGAESVILQALAPPCP